MRVLVTGGAGFIGSCVVRALLSSGHELAVVDDLSTGRPENLPEGVALHDVDILDDRLHALVTRVSPEAVVHLAAQVDVGASVRDARRDWAVNVEGTGRVARAAAEAGVRRVVSASSAAVYGEPSAVPLAEGAPKVPANPYGRSKLAAEGVLAEELRSRAVDFASLRFANVYGERQDWRGEGGVVAVFAAAMTAGLRPAVYGAGMQTRDFVYVGDVASAVLDALAAEGALAGPGTDGPAYNVSTGEETSVEELAERIAAVAGYSGAIERLPRRDGDIDRSALDPGKAERVFGWRAATPLGQGLERTVAWFRERT